MKTVTVSILVPYLQSRLDRKARHGEDRAKERFVGLRTNWLYGNVAVPPAPIRVPNQWSIVPSATPVTSVDNYDNEVKPGAGTDLLAITLRLWKTPGNFS